MAENTVTTVDENTRRYYLDIMGIQCWELIQGGVESDSVTTSQADTLEPERDESMQQLALDVQHCNSCQLHTDRKQAITGRGHLSPELMFVFLSPDQKDDDSGILCSGEANSLFTKMLAAIDIAIDDVYITSLLKCRVSVNHTVSPSEINHCSDFLKRQVHLLRPRLLVVLGETAARCMLQRDASLDNLRSEINAGVSSDMISHNSSNYQHFESVPLFVSYSPRELVQQTENKRKAWQDLQQIQKILAAC